VSNTRERETRAPTHPTRHPRWMSLFHAAAITDADLPTPVPSRSPTADIISAVEFDKTGEHLATGDRGGRVVLFERMHPSKAALVRATADPIDFPTVNTRTRAMGVLSNTRAVGDDATDA